MLRILFWAGLQKTRAAQNCTNCTDDAAASDPGQQKRNKTVAIFGERSVTATCKVSALSPARHSEREIAQRQHTSGGRAPVTLLPAAPPPAPPPAPSPRSPRPSTPAAFSQVLLQRRTSSGGARSPAPAAAPGPHSPPGPPPAAGRGAAPAASAMHARAGRSASGMCYARSYFWAGAATSRTAKHGAHGRQKQNNVHGASMHGRVSAPASAPAVPAKPRRQPRRTSLLVPRLRLRMTRVPQPTSSAR